MRRNMWLVNPKTGAKWDLLPTDPYKKDDGTPFLKISGLGYSQALTQNQVGVDYFVSEITSKNVPIKGSLYFWNTTHIARFQDCVGDFRDSLMLYYSPSGEFHIGDDISKIYYKPVKITQIDKTEYTKFGYFECATIITPQSDVWKRDVQFEAEIDTKNIGEPLVYPFTYPYVFGGRNTISLEIENTGRETGCKVMITNNSAKPIQTVEWFCDNHYLNQYNIEVDEVQRAKFYVTLSESGTMFTIDSNALTQEATVTYNDGTSQSVVAQQEPSTDYINFIQLRHGMNRFIFYLDNIEGVTINVSYTDQKEII